MNENLLDGYVSSILEGLVSNSNLVQKGGDGKIWICDSVVDKAFSLGKKCLEKRKEILDNCDKDGGDFVNKCEEDLDLEKKKEELHYKVVELEKIKKDLEKRENKLKEVILDAEENKSGGKFKTFE